MYLAFREYTDFLTSMKIIRTIISGLFLLVGGILLMSIVQAFIGNGNNIGELLWNSYSYAAFGSPLLFFWIFAVLLYGNTHVYRLVSPMLAVFPLLFFGIACNIMLWQPPDAVPPFWITVKLFGQTASVVLWFFIGSVIMVCIAIFHAMCTIWVQKHAHDATLQADTTNTLKNTVSKNYKKFTSAVHKIVKGHVPSPKDYVKSTPSETHNVIQNEAAPLSSSSETFDAQEETYNTMKVETHAQNHTGAKYTPEVSMMHPKDDRYLLIFNRERLHNMQMQLHQELEEESIQDVVPLGAESYISDQTTIAKVHSDSLNSKHDYEGVENEWASAFENAPEVYQKLEVNNDNENFTNSTTSSNDTNEFVDPSFLDDSSSESVFEVMDEDKKKLSLKKAYEHTTEILDNSAQYSEIVQDRKSGDREEQEKRDGTLPYVLSTVANKEAERISKKENKKKSTKYFIPIHGVLNPPSKESEVDMNVVESTAKKLEETLKEFSIDAKVTSYCRGPVVTMFEILPAPGVRLNRIVALGDNIALRLAASSIRIVAPIPGKEAVGIEVPNVMRDVVSLSELIAYKKFYSKDTALPIVLGKDVSGQVQVSDLSRMPHLLIAGATGSGKSVCINTLLCSLLFRCDPAELKLLLIDPKTVELNFYNDIAHLLTPVIDDPERSVQALRWCVKEMERRYQLLGNHGVREIRSYNAKMASQNIAKAARMPYLVIVIDEFADLMLTCSKEIETLVARIAAKSRAVGIHLVLATQRPSTDVITGIIKANIPSRIAFMVASKTDSRIILDQNGADKLLGRGDMLFSSASDLYPMRIQGAFLSEEEVSRVVSHVKAVGGDSEYIDEDELFSDGNEVREAYDGPEDPIWNEAVREVQETNRASASYLQRRFRIGYNRASRLIEMMEIQGIISAPQGSKPRSVISNAA